jgi:hypothetical protein
MAVVDNVSTKSTHPMPNVKLSGAKVMEVITTINKAASDSDGSKYLIAEIPGNAIIHSISLEGAAVALMTSAKVGLFLMDGTAVNDALFLGATDFSTTTGLPTGPLGQPIRQCATALGVANAEKNVYELAGHVNKAVPATGETQKKEKYKIALTATTAGPNAGTWVARVCYLVPGA